MISRRQRRLPGAARFASLLLLAACRSADLASPPPLSPHLTPDEIAAAAEAAAEELARWRRERDEEWLEVVDPGEAAEHTHRYSLAQVEARLPSLEAVFLQGEAIFERRFTPHEGLGTGMLARPAPALSRVENAAGVGGPDALSCKQCHGRGGDDGHGELHQRALLDGDGIHARSAKPRLAPHVAGLGVVQLLAAEATAELARQVAALRIGTQHGASSQATTLWWAGIDFGSVQLRPDGSLDTSGLRGIDADLVVKPLGWKGTHATLRSFVREALPQHLGLELPVLNPPLPNPDNDRDGIPSELNEGQLTSLVAYLALLDTPVVLPPRTEAAQSAFHRGAARFEALGCATCHRPELALKEVAFVERAPGGGDQGLVLDLERDNQVAPKLEQFDYTRGRGVRLFSDLKRHDMGPGLAERVDHGVPASVFLTRPLWGLGDRGNYFLHDGRARTLRDAIRLHGGEAQQAATAFGKLTPTEQREVEVFLLSLRREPQGRIVP